MQNKSLRYMKMIVMIYSCTAQQQWVKYFVTKSIFSRSVDHIVTTLQTVWPGSDSIKHIIPQQSPSCPINLFYNLLMILNIKYVENVFLYPSITSREYHYVGNKMAPMPGRTDLFQFRSKLDIPRDFAWLLVTCISRYSKFPDTHCS